VSSSYLYDKNNVAIRDVSTGYGANGYPAIVGFDLASGLGAWADDSMY